MRILIAEDDKTSRMVLETTLRKWGHEVVSTIDGDAAWEALQAEAAPTFAILDWLMPGEDGPSLCRKARTLLGGASIYIILLTALGHTEHIVAGLDAGANDYITKPFKKEELRARIQVGERVVTLQNALANRVTELEKAMTHIRTLQGILPICMHCHKVRTEKSSWQELADYIHDHTEAEFSHGLCDECLEEYYPESDEADEDENFAALGKIIGKNGKRPRD